jgi:hypothetical protein
MRLFQVLWKGIPESVRSEIHVRESISIVNNVITPINTLNHCLQLVTAEGDVILPCKECISRRITETISYRDLTITSRGTETILDVTIRVLCNGCAHHKLETEIYIVIYVGD